MREYLRRVLESEGYTVDEANDGVACLERMRYALPDAVILDIYMPEKDGLEVLREFQEGRSPTPVLAITGADMTGRPSFLYVAEKLGARQTLKKPFTPDDLLTAIRSLLQE